MLFRSAAGLNAVITHHGGVTDRARIKALYLDADVFLLPSYYPTEAQPLTIIEALNAGTPVVVTRHSGIPEMVRGDKEALFVPPRAPDTSAVARSRRLTLSGSSSATSSRSSAAESPTTTRPSMIPIVAAPLTRARAKKSPSSVGLQTT